MDFERQLNFSGEILKEKANSINAEPENPPKLLSCDYQICFTTEEANINTAESSKNFSFDKKQKQNKNLNFQNQQNAKLQKQLDKKNINALNIIGDFGFKKDKNWSISSCQNSRKNSIEFQYENNLDISKTFLPWKKEPLRSKSKISNTNHKINKIKKEAKQLFIGVDLLAPTKTINSAKIKSFYIADNTNKYFLNSRTLSFKNTERFKNIYIKNKTIFKSSGKFTNFIVDNFTKNTQFNYNVPIGKVNKSRLEIVSLTAKRDNNNKCISAFGIRKIKSKEYFDLRLEKKSKNAIVYDSGMFSIPLMQTVEK
jgi:hypothetical protein